MTRLNPDRNLNHPIVGFKKRQKNPVQIPEPKDTAVPGVTCRFSVEKKLHLCNDSDVLHVHLMVLLSWTMSWLVLPDFLLKRAKGEVLVPVSVLDFCKNVDLYKNDRCNFFFLLLSSRLDFFHIHSIDNIFTSFLCIRLRRLWEIKWHKHFS